jgi:hypothetical protein
VPQDYNAAFKLFTLAARQGNAGAQHNLGVMYGNGDGVSQDDKTAVKWYTLAAQQGDAGAQFGLGLAHYYGEGVIQDYVMAHMWLNIASSNGEDPNARNDVAKKMTPGQIQEAQKLAREWMKAHNE